MRGMRALAKAHWLNARLGPVAAGEVRKLARAYRNPDLTLADCGFLLMRRPLEIYCAGELVRNPARRWNELWAQKAALLARSHLHGFSRRARPVAHDSGLEHRAHQDPASRRADGAGARSPLVCDCYGESVFQAANATNKNVFWGIAAISMNHGVEEHFPNRHFDLLDFFGFEQVYLKQADNPSRTDSMAGRSLAPLV
jgi:hypothetical protein